MELPSASESRNQAMAGSTAAPGTSNSYDRPVRIAAWSSPLPWAAAWPRVSPPLPTRLAGFGFPQALTNDGEDLMNVRLASGAGFT